jgi:hypothetical protein
VERLGQLDGHAAKVALRGARNVVSDIGMDAGINGHIQLVPWIVAWPTYSFEHPE